MKKIRFTLIFLGLCFALKAQQSPIEIRPEASLEFGVIVANSGPITIPPETSPSSNSARFLVRGEKRSAYTIILPASAQMSHVSFPNDQISFSNFQSNPEEGANGFLGNNGRQRVYVGATMENVAANLMAGEYQGNFSVEVIY